jgi:hypothetical protein
VIDASVQLIRSLAIHGIEQSLHDPGDVAFLFPAAKKGDTHFSDSLD